MAEILRFSVTGLDCTSCVQRVETAARGLTGVTAARTSLPSGTLEVERAAGGHTAETIAAAIAATGHSLVPLEARQDPA